MELERAKKFLCNFDSSSWKIILLNVHLVKENNPLQFKVVSFYFYLSAIVVFKERLQYNLIALLDFPHSHPFPLHQDNFLKHM